MKKNNALKKKNLDLTKQEKKKIKNFYRIPITISIITFIILVFLIPFPFVIFNKGYYYAQYEQNNVYELVGRNNTRAITFQLMTFLRCDENAMQKINKTLSCETFLKGNYSNNGREFYFTPEERSHMHDVKTLIRIAILMAYLSIMVFILVNIFMFISIKRKDKRTKNFFNLFSKITFKGSLILIIIYVVIYLLSLISSFSLLFDFFHRLFFPMGNYTFSNSSLLITMFPESFFYGAGKTIFLSGFITATIALILSFILNLLVRMEKN